MTAYVKFTTQMVPPAKPAKTAKVDQNLSQFSHFSRLVSPYCDFQTSPPHDRDALAERTAIVEHEAGIPRLWAEGYARLLAMPMPAGFTVDQWQAVLDACGRFLDGWAARLAALGWTTLDLFGCQPGAPRARLDGAGLLLLLPGSEIIAVTADTVKLRTQTGAVQSFSRCAVSDPGRVALWELAP